MAHSELRIPGETTRYDDCPKVVMTGGGNTSVTVTVTYHAALAPPGTRATLGEVAFLNVLEIRWIDCDASYEEYPQHEDDYEFGLIEILDSAYIETMASRGVYHDHPGNRIRGNPEDSVRHFRMGFDKWGELNVIATGFSVRMLDE